MKGTSRGLRRHLVAALLALGGVSLLSDCADVGAPDGVRRGRVAFAPAMSSAAAAALGTSSTVIDNVRIVIRTLDGTIVLDTIVQFPAGADEVSIAADIPVHGNNERFRATIQLRSGSEVLFEGTQDLDVRPGAQSGPTPPIPVTYVGTGANAVSLVLAPGDVTLQAGASSQLVATVRDQTGNVIPNVPLGWASSDNAIATVSSDGIVSVKSIRGVAIITAATLGGISGTSRVHVVLPASQLHVVGGGGQTGRVGATLTSPFVVELLAADGVGIANASISFAAFGTGASIAPSTATTDGNGRASASVTLGTTAGTYTYTAAAGSFLTSIEATATPGDANRIVIAGGDGQSALSGTLLLSPLSVRVTDEFGNPGAGRQVNWKVVTAGTLGSATTLTNASGIATNTYTLPAAVGTHTVSATLEIGGASVSFSETALARPASAITASSGGSQAGPVNTAAQPLVARVTDVLDQPVANVVVSWRVSGTALVSDATSTTNASGFATVGASFGPTPGPSIVTASIPSGASTQFVLNAGATPASIEIVAGNNQTGTPGNAVTIAPSVRVLDALRNPIAGVTVTFGAVAGGGSVTGGTQVTNALGIATVGSWILGGFTPLQTLTATAGTVNVTFNATTGIVTGSIGVAAGDGQIVTTGQPLQPLVARVLDLSESGVPGVTIQFTVISGGATPTTFSTVTDANGHATFSTLISGPAGPGTVKACIMPACVNFTHFTFTTITSGSIWTGNTSSNWFTASNWSPATVPGSGSNVFIPANSTNILVLTAGVSLNEFFMASGSLISMGANEMQIGSKVTTTGAFVLGSGTFRLTAVNAPITGSMPSLILTGGNVTASGTTTVQGNVTVEGGGLLNVGAGSMTVSGGFNVDPAGRLTMNSAAGSLTINGDAFFQGQDMGNTEITAGLLEVRGNFTATGFNQAFRANGTHTTRLIGFNAQNLSFFQSGVAASRFQNLEIANASAGGITMSSNVYVAGTLLQGGRLTVPTSRAFTIGGTLTLQSGSITTVNGGGSLIHGGCTNQGGTATGFTC